MVKLRSSQRRPIWEGPRLGLVDWQGAIPRFWCRCCGSEVFLRGKDYCPRCEKEETYEQL